MKKTKLILSFYVGVIALGVSTIAMSVAWYATNARLTIDSIVINVDGDRDLKISASKDEGYVEHISIDKTQFKDVLMPLTSAYSSEWVSISDKPIFYDDSKASTVEGVDTRTAAVNGYFSQKFYVKSDDDVFVSIDPKKTTLVPNEVENAKYARVLYEEYQEGKDEYKKSLSIEDIKNQLDEVVNSIRYSIYIPTYEEAPYEIIDPKKDGDTYYAGLLDNDVDRYYDYYQKSSDGQFYERVYGEYSGELIYDEPIAEDSAYSDVDEEPNAFNAMHKKDIKLFNLEKSLENGLEIKKEPSHSLSDFDVTYKPYHFPVYRSEPAEIILSLYVEGWDLDSVNYTMGAGFISTLSFMIEREIQYECLF